MITRSMALTLRTGTELHYGHCRAIVGPRGGVTRKVETWRVNGACKTWKTRPNDFQVPIKFGFRGPYGYLTQDNMVDFHLAFECMPEEVSK